MTQLQLIGITPEQLQNSIIESVQTQLQEFKEHFEPKTTTEYLTRKETAKLLSVNLSTLHHYVKSKKFPAYGIGKRVLFKRADIEQALIHLNK